MKVKNYKCVVFLLIFSLFAGMWNGNVVKGAETGTPAASDGMSGKVIREITIAGVTPPETIDEKPSTEGIEVEKVVVESASVETAKVETAEVETAVVETKNVEWKSDAGNDAYTLSITLEAKDGYEFGDSLKVVVKGTDGKEYLPKEIGIGEGSKTATVTWEFSDGGATTPPIPPTATPTESPISSDEPATFTTSPAPSAATPQEINKVIISDIMIPKAGEKFRVISPTIDTEGVKMPTIESGTIEWIKGQGEGSQTVGIEDEVEYETAYGLRLTLEAGEGYTFSENVEVTVKDNLGSILAPADIGRENGKIIVTITFTTESLQEINEVIIGNITIPKVGGTFPTISPRIDTGAIETPMIEWQDGDGKTVNENVGYDPDYKLCLTLKAKKGYTFVESVGVTVKDDEENILESKHIKNEEGEIIVTIEFKTSQTLPPSTEEPSVIDKVTISNIAKPVNGEKFPKESPEIKSDGIKEISTEWQDNSGNKVHDKADVDDGTSYKLCLTLKVEDGYEFPEKSGDLHITVKDTSGNELKEKVEVAYEKDEEGKIINIVVTITFEIEPLPQKPTPTPQVVNKVKEVTISNIAKPVSGKKFPKESPEIESDGIKEVSTIEWQDNSGNKVHAEANVGDGTSYKLCLTLKVEDGYEFPETSDDLRITVKDISGNKLKEKIEVAYERDEEGKIINVVVTITFEIEPSSQPSTPTPIPSGEPSQPPAPIQTLQPTPTPGTYTITLNANGGTLSQKKITFTADQMSKVKLPTPKKKGFLFIGWYQGKTRVSQITKANNISLKAQWVKSTIDLTYQSTIKCVSKLKLSSDVKLEKIKIEKKYKKYITINQKKMTMKGTKYVKKAVATVTIDGEEFEVTVKMKLPKPKVVATPEKRMKYYVTGAYREFRFSYKNAVKGATKVVAEYKPSNAKSFKKCGSIQNRFKGAYALVKKGNSVWFRVTIYYGRYASPKSKKILLKG